MKVSYTIVPSGDMAGVLAYRVSADTAFDPDAALDQIRNHQSTQPVVVVILDNGTNDELIENFCKNMRAQFKCTLVLSTDHETPRPIWHLVDRVVLRTAVLDYRGTPVNEVHMLWTPNVDYPVVAPLGAQQTHVYAYAPQDELDQLIEWVRQAPYQIGIIRRAL